MSFPSDIESRGEHKTQEEKNTESNAVINLTVRTDKPEQTVETQIRRVWSGSALFASDPFMGSPVFNGVITFVTSCLLPAHQDSSEKGLV